MVNDDVLTHFSQVTEPAGLSLEDLLIDEQSNNLTEYLALSITPIGADTQVSVTTVGMHPITYSMVLHGISAEDLPALMGGVMTL